MPFAEEHDGIWSFVIGLIVLVMVGIGLSVLVDRREGSSAGSKTIRKDIRDNETHLEDLRSHHEEKSNRLVSCERQNANQLEAARSAASAARSVAELAAAKDLLAREVEKLEGDYAAYRVGYRRKVWARALGESLGTLTLNGGKEYQQVVISRVTEVGLEIRHEHGISRVHAPDLPISLQDRFQWNEDERRNRLKEELGLDEPVSDSGPGKKADKRTGDSGKKDLSALRAKVAGAQAKVANLSAEFDQANFQAQSGAQASVPGSLETWRAKSKRLQGEIKQANIELNIAEARLATVSPGDLLLVKDNAP